MQKVIVPEKIDNMTDHFLAKQGYDVITVKNPDEENILRLAPDAAAVVMYISPIPNTMYAKMPNLKVLARNGVGFDNIDVDYAAKSGVWVTNTPGSNAISVAEFAVTDLLLLAKRSVEFSQRMLKWNDWGARQLMSHEIFGSTVGIIGFGHIGQQVAKMLSGFGVKVLYYNRSKRDSEYGTQVDLDTLLKESDYVTVHIAATPQTEGLLGAREFKLMKNTASLVNTARGTIIDEPALVDALKSGEIASAALDVFDQEPLPADSQLLKLDNAFLTPHVASNTESATLNSARGAVKMADQVLKGQKPDWAVNQPDAHKLR